MEEKKKQYTYSMVKPITRISMRNAVEFHGGIQVRNSYMRLCQNLFNYLLGQLRDKSTLFPDLRLSLEG